MRNYPILGALVLGAALAACSGATTGSTSDNPAPAGYKASGADSAAAGTQTVQLQSVNNSGITGTAVLHPDGNKTSVMLMLVPAAGGTTAGQEHAAHVHTGTCAEPGPIVAPLGTVKGDDKGYNSTTADVDIPIATLTDGQHVVAAHATASDSSATIACAGLSGM